MNPTIVNSLKQLDEYIQDQEFKGYDPYDALNSLQIKKIQNKWEKIFLTQLLVYSPINFRSFFGIEKEYNPKGIGLLLSAYCKMYEKGVINKKYFDKTATELVNLLLKTKSKGYSGYCWGFNFDWQDPIRFAPKKTPTIVISSYIGHGFLELYNLTKEEKYLKIAESITDFILEDLHITKLDTGICFSYTPVDTHLVHNANCLGAAFLARVYSHTHNQKLIHYATKALDFTVSYQKKKGYWPYLIDSETGKERYQTDFHQGFIIDSLCNYLLYTQKNNDVYYKSLKKAAMFYMTEQFHNDGRAKWRLPRRYPIDIHHLAQGIITFKKMFKLTKNSNYLNFSNKIAQWTIENMQDEKGFFYYQKWSLFTNKIEYMRWSQAWMLLALSLLIDDSKFKEGR